jgi:hypothetical protein
MLLLPAVQAAREAARSTSDGDTFVFSDTESLSFTGDGSANLDGYWDYNLRDRGHAGGSPAYAELEGQELVTHYEPPIDLF